LRRTRYQFGTVEKKKRNKGPDVWVYRYYVWGADGAVKHASKRLGTVEQYRTKAQAKRAAEATRMVANLAQPDAVPVTMGGLIDRYIADKLPQRYSTRVSYLSCLNGHIRPRWGEHTLQRIAAAPFEVEKWFEQLDLAPKTKGHLKALMHRLFECAMKWALCPLGRNPMELVEIKDVTKRLKPPRVLTHDEFWDLLNLLEEPYRTMVLVAQCLGLRISEVMALQWSDFDFANLTVRVQRGVVHGRVDLVKTEYSNDDLPLDPDLCALLQHWKQQCPVTADHWVFPNPNTLKPYWQETICKKQIQPAAVKAGLGTNIGWHSFRHTYRSWLDSTGAPIAMQRELMRHASIETTMNVYGRAMMSDAKRQANSNVVQIALRPGSSSKAEGGACGKAPPSIHLIVPRGNAAINDKSMKALVAGGGFEPPTFGL